MKYFFLTFFCFRLFAGLSVGINPSEVYTTNDFDFNYNDIAANRTLILKIPNTFYDFTGTNILICYRLNDIQSLESAQIANNTWGSNCHLLAINNANMTTKTDHWGTADMDYADVFDSVSDCETDYITAIENYIDSNQQIKLIANAYRMPVRDDNITPDDSDSLLSRFYESSKYDFPTKNKDNIYLFSFGCRTFDDTTNLLRFTESFSITTNGYFVQDDCQDTYSSSFPAGNYLSALSGNVIYDSTDNALTSASANIYYLLENGYWAGYRDDYLKSGAKFNTYPNSICMTIESYNLMSYRKGTVRYHQSRLYDCFDMNCNGGNYNKIFGCAVGHVNEPGWLGWNVQEFWLDCENRYSYLESFYFDMAYSKSESVHIIMGNPFLTYNKLNQ